VRSLLGAAITQSTASAAIRKSALIPLRHFRQKFICLGLSIVIRGLFISSFFSFVLLPFD
jgi:hypothetical protein